VSRASSDGVISSGIALLSADSVGYLSLAASVDWLTATPWNRVLYIALLRIGQGWGDPANFIVAVQLIALVLASAIAHRLATDLAGRWAGLAATLVLAVNPLVAQWAQFVLTETLFFTLIMATLWAGRRVMINAEDRRSALLLATLGLLAALLRPNGVLVLGSALTIVSLRAAGGRRVLLILLTWTVVGVGLWSGLMAAGQPAERSLTEQLHGGIVVEGADHVRTAVTMPAPRDPADVSMGAALEYVLRHPVATTRLAVSRMAVESVQIRRHYPRAVNLAVGLAVSLLFVLAATAAMHQRSRTLLRAALLIGVPLLLMVGATFATPEGRYGWSYLVLLAPFGGIGFATILQRPRVRALKDQSPAGPGIER
jgi:4-amino-4-deoxy-L-arabinose transferase-like glycosyltransferase